MLKQRVPGRPLRGVKEVGRPRIISSMREMMRNGDCRDLSRKGVAKKIGITPSLITYYFPKNTSLVQEVTEPVIKSYYDGLCSITRSEIFEGDRLTSIISLLVDLYIQDSDILEAYEVFAKSRDNSAADNLIDLINVELAEFFETAMLSDADARFGAEFLASAMWGTCEFVGKFIRQRSNGADFQTNRRELCAAIFGQISDLIANGLDRRITSVGDVLKVNSMCAPAA